jgi:hypothetical protein
MKKLILSAAFAAMLASPAFAQSYNPQYGTGNTFNEPAREMSNGFGGGAQAFAQAPDAVSDQGLHAGPAVYAFGHYVGTDPDPNIRVQLERDWPGRD